MSHARLHQAELRMRILFEKVLEDLGDVEVLFLRFVLSHETTDDLDQQGMLEIGDVLGCRVSERKVVIDNNSRGVLLQFVNNC